MRWNEVVVAWVSPGWVSAWLVGLSGMAVCWNKVVLHGCHRAGFPPGWAGYLGWVCAGMRWFWMGVTWLGYRLAGPAGGRAMWAGCMLEWGGVAWVSPSWVSASLGGLCVLGICWKEVMLHGCHLAGFPPGWAGYLGWLYAGSGIIRWSCCMDVTWLGFRLAGRAIIGLAVCWNEVVLHGCHRAGFPPRWAGYVGWLYAGMRWCCMGVIWPGFRLAGRAVCGLAVRWNEVVLHGCHLAGLPPGWAGYVVGWPLFTGMDTVGVDVSKLVFVSQQTYSMK